MPQTQRPSQLLHLVWIKPSHYDDDGYVIRWWRSAIPANSLATVYGIAQDCAERRVLGPDVEVRLHALDETNTRIDPKRLIKRLRKTGGRILIGMIGVQSNQFPRTLELARQFLALGVPVAIGGFHVSGSLAMFTEPAPELKEAMAIGCSLFAGELEDRLAGLLQDLMRDALKPLYNYLGDLPDLTGMPTPILPAERVRLNSGLRSSFDAGRGCPYMCSFCTIINVQGHKSRHRTADDVERLVRANVAQGITNFFITDDNLARNANWEPILDRLIAMQDEGIRVKLFVQVDTQSHRIPRFIEKAGKAGVTRAFLGMENINPDALKSAQKGQNKIDDYRAMLQAWHRVGVLTYAGYILGFPNDTPETIRRDLEIIKREIPVDILELFILTPLPGSQDHKHLVESGARLDPDLNKYDLQHVVADHPRMTKEEWQSIYREAWDIYYSPEHVATVLRRCRAWGFDPKEMQAKMFAFHAPIVYENLHPLEGGLIRIKHRRDRRPELPLEPPLVFYPKLLFEFVRKYAGAFAMHRRYLRIWKQVMSEPPGRYEDTAMRQVGTVDEGTLDLLTATPAARQFAEKRRAQAARRGAVKDARA
jgi:radical SAM superfamily enzyme YgiQ (UPF0313 family)